jgi:ubiquinone/menaquinone biosynthesis C-methylase UbiE
MDYDKTTIATTYDAARGYRPEVLRQWLDLIAAHVSAHPTLILDVGCGTGRFTFPMAEHFQTRVIGIDPSEKMLEGARKKLTNDRVEFRQATAELIPMEDGSADIIFMSMILHHLNDRARTAQECRRVLREGGRVCVRNSTRDSIYPQSRFFPGMLPMIKNELPLRDEVVAIFENAGLQLAAYQRVSHFVATGWRDLADKLAMRADSFLTRLPEAEFEAGMAALTAYANHCDPLDAIIEDIHFFVFGR